MLGRLVFFWVAFKVCTAILGAGIWGWGGLKACQLGGCSCADEGVDCVLPRGVLASAFEAAIVQIPEPIFGGGNLDVVRVLHLSSWLVVMADCDPGSFTE